jgi:fructoselysine-6-P-deglycase FrlB-like protein
MSRTATEIASQPGCWRRAAGMAAAPDGAAFLPPSGVELAVTGCGTSLYVAQACATLRERAGAGRTDAFPASEFPRGRHYQYVLALTRSGTTSEVVALLERLAGEATRLLVTGVDDAPASGPADRRLLLDFADEESVVQTRFATTTLAFLRAALGEDVERAASDAERALAAPLPVDPAATEQVTFLGTGWTVGLASEAALKLREAAQAWAEAYPAMEYRHGPISIAAPGRAVWPIGPLPPGLADEVRATGATLVDTGDLDPLAGLVLAQRYAVAAAECRGLDPDKPRSLTRSVILPSTEVPS